MFLSCAKKACAPILKNMTAMRFLLLCSSAFIQVGLELVNFVAASHPCLVQAVKLNLDCDFEDVIKSASR